MLQGSVGIVNFTHIVGTGFLRMQEMTLQLRKNDKPRVNLYADDSSRSIWSVIALEIYRPLHAIQMICKI